MKEDIRLDILFFLYLLLSEFYQIKKAASKYLGISLSLFD